MLLLSIQNEKLWIHSRLRTIRFDLKRPHENPDYKHKEINLEEPQDTWCIFYLLKHKRKEKNHIWLTCVQNTVYICINTHIYVTLKIVYCWLRWPSLTEYCSQYVTIILIVSRFPQILPGHTTTGSSLKHDDHIPKGCIIDIYYHLSWEWSGKRLNKRVHSGISFWKEKGGPEITG